MSQVKVLDPDGQGIPLVCIRISDGDRPQEAATYDVICKTDGTTGWPIPGWNNGRRTLYVNVGDYAIPGWGVGKAIDPVDRDADGDIVVTLQRVGVESGFIKKYLSAPDHDDPSRSKNLVYGFIAEDGKPWQYVGYSAYLLVSCVKKGQDIVPFIRRVQSYDANVLVTLGAALSPWCVSNGFGFDPREQATKDAIAKIFDVCAAEKMRVCHMVASDFQHGGLSDGDKTRIWNEQCDIMDGRWNVFAACGKEQDVNGWDVSLFPQRDLHGVLQSAGSAGEGKPPLHPSRDFSMWETRKPEEGGDPWHKCLDDAGAGMFEQQAGYAGFPATRCPVVMIEGIHLADTDPDHVGDRRTTDKERALMFGLQIGASCAGGAVLTSLGQEGKLDGAVAAECARQQIRGMRTAFLR
jgi:hypothetical protein